jgi:FkbM family methyltransferase
MKTDGYFVEVGAFDGINWSNTYGLVQLGWSGLYFEPNPEIYNSLLYNHGKNNKLAMIKKAISNYSGTATLYKAGSVSTIKRETKELYLDLPEFAHGEIHAGETIEVEVATLDEELDRLSVPAPFDLLVIDVEGSEVDVLEGFSIEKYMPTLAIIEAHEKFRDERLSAKSQDINKYMDNAGYEKIYSDHINSIYIKEK